MKRSPVVVMVVALATVIALIVIPAGLASAGASPVLGNKKAFPSGKGFGSVKPKTVFLGGDPTGLFTKLTWNGWGKSKATGTGKGNYPPPGKPVADAVKVPVTLVASSLGSCHGRQAYRKLAVYFEYKGHKKSGIKTSICV
jgi:hypothetical protein